MTEQVAQPFTQPAQPQPSAPPAQSRPVTPALPSPPPQSPQSQPASSQLSLEKKKSAKKLLVLIIFLLFFLGGGGWLYKAGVFRKLTTGSGGIIIPQQTPGAEVKDKFRQDTDGDGLPDFVELAIGYDSNQKDCQHEAGCGEAELVSLENKNVLFILDSSGSMAQTVGGQVKMDSVKAAVKKHAGNLAKSSQVGLMVYGHKGSNSPADRAASCAGIELLYPVGLYDQAAFEAAVDQFQPTGWTPIAGSLQRAKGVFIGLEGINNHIILISDGIEACEGDPCGVAKELKESEIRAVVDVIGFDVDQAVEDQLTCVALATEGTYFDARSSQDLENALEQIDKEIQAPISVEDCLTRNFIEFRDCLAEHYLKAISACEEKKIEALSAGDNEESFKYSEVAGTLRGILTFLEEEATDEFAQDEEKIRDLLGQLDVLREGF